MTFRASIELLRAPRAVRLVAETARAFAARLAAEREREAFARGHAACDAESRASAVAALERAIDAIDAARREVLDAVARDSVELAVAIAAELVRAEIAHDRHDIERLVRETLAASGAGRGACTVHLHPSDAARLAGVSFRAGTTIEADVEIAKGDAHVTTARGVCVREVDAVIAAIGEQLREEVA